MTAVPYTWIGVLLEKMGERTRAGNAVNLSESFPDTCEQMTVTHGENKVTTNGLPKKEAEVNPIAYYSVALKATLFLPYRHGLTTP